MPSRLPGEPGVRPNEGQRTKGRDRTVAHRVYGAIVRTIKSGALVEPFSKADFEASCPGFGAGTYNAFLDKHARGNRGGNTELFERVSPGKFKCARPFRYGL
jgi:hypothetical protein